MNRCIHCARKYTPEPKQHCYFDEVRKQAMQLYVEGMNLCRIGCHLGLHHRTVSLWVDPSPAGLIEVPVPREVKTVEMDELFIFIGHKKQDLHPDYHRPANKLLSGL